MGGRGSLEGLAWDPPLEGQSALPLVQASSAAGAPAPAGFVRASSTVQLCVNLAPAVDAWAVGAADAGRLSPGRLRGA